MSTLEGVSLILYIYLSLPFTVAEEDATDLSPGYPQSVNEEFLSVLVDVYPIEKYPLPGSELNLIHPQSFLDDVKWAFYIRKP